MAKPVFSKRLFLLGAALVVGGPLLAGCEPAVPSQPTFEADVRPIMMSHCVRCHGAGGTLNQTKQPVEDGGIINTIMVTNSYFNQYGDTGACGATADPNNPCHFGALTWAVPSEIPAVIDRSHSALPMPPPPAPNLDDWEIKVLDAWVAEKPTPLCSSSANPDPTICPPGAGQADAGQ